MASFKVSASPSSSKPVIRGWTYDVFLSFRGEDTRNNFVDHLYAAFVQKGIRTFKDDDMIRKGKPISPELLKAIDESRFAVVVFSKDYANSSWCLEELVKIMECEEDQKGNKVLPVFYYVDPSDVRGQKGDFGMVFEQQEKEMNKVNKWRKALAAAASISGYHISSVSGGESATINKIVQEIIGDIQPHRRETNLIGIESHMDALTSLLSIEAIDEVRIIGILGMGGIGKTTIARALFRRVAYMFEGSSFISNVRENSKSKRDICALQEKILRDILAAHHGFTIQDPEFGADMIQERFCNKKVLLVLDDVDNDKQLEFLAATHGWFGPGSRIIITTRDERILSDTNAKYKPPLLCMDQALELFSKHAFKKNSPPDEFLELSNRAIRCTGRLPLALKVLGSFFRGRKAHVWESALDRLTETPNSEIFETMKLSFDGLEESEKKIFLDIACFFKGKKLDNVTRVLDSFSFYAGIGVASLIEKSLITVLNNRLDMHDLIQEMALQVVCQSAPNSRLWKNEDIYAFIKENKKLDLIEGITVNPWEYNVRPPQGFSADVFESMKNLRLLDVHRNFTYCEPTFFPHDLRWLRWNKYLFSYLPLANMCKLVGLEMEYANIKHLWKGRKIMRSLKFIQLKDLDYISRFPDVSEAPNIERLVLSQCTNLVEVHESLGHLKRLVYLEMINCAKLKCFRFRIEMESLETLILRCCSSLERLPEFSPCMVKLSYIDVGYCYSLGELPSSIRNVSNLSILNLIYCTSLNNIPDSICELKCLKNLLLGGSKLQKLPDDFKNMENLQELDLKCIESFDFHPLPNLCSLRKLDLSWNDIGDDYFPTNLDALSSLEELDLSYNSKLKQLPASISRLSHLKRLDIYQCPQLQNIDGLPSGIQILDASHCISLETVKDISKEYEWLHNICLLNCKKLLEDKQNERYLDKMLNQFFLKKWAARDGSLSISIPGKKIPNWFKEQRYGNTITLQLPPKWQTQIAGFAICGVFGQWSPQIFPCIKFRFENSGMFVPNLEVNCINESPAGEEETLWIAYAYIPFSLLDKMHDNNDDDDNYDCQCEDWSHITEGNLVIDLTSIPKSAVSCGAYFVYKEDLESTQQVIKPSISSTYYWNWKLTHWWSQNTIKCS